MKHIFLIIVCLAAAAPGCAQFDLMDKLKSLRIKETGEFRRPLKLVAYWTDTIRTEAGRVPERGFGGRMMFYDEGHGKPVKVKGHLAVYAFDEAHRDPKNPRPDRKYVFAAEDLEKHYSKSELGHSYSFYIPWDQVGGETKGISLICRFTTLDGAVVVSDQTRQLLPGTTPEGAAATQSAVENAAPVSLVEYQEPAEQFSQRSMTTTTIDLASPTSRELPTALARPRPAWPSGPGPASRSASTQTSGPITASAPVQSGTVISAPAANPPADPLGSDSTAPYSAHPAVRHQAGEWPAQAPSRTMLARFARNRSPVPIGPTVPQANAPGPRQPIRAGRLSAPQSIQAPDPAPRSYPPAAEAQP
jgi:hypothetical protein